jgi:FMN phosphatase YigB (HAD superfamily)
MDMTKRTLWLDYDDTIGGILLAGRVQPGHRAYFDCIDRFVGLMSGISHDGDRARVLQQEIDLEAAKIIGFGDKTRFAHSMLGAYSALCNESGRYYSPHYAKVAYEIGMSVFTDYPYVPLDGVPEVLAQLKPDYNIVVVTKGETVEQNKKLTDTGLAALVDTVIVMDHKTQDEWVERVFRPLGFYEADDLKATVAIGNSIKSDVNPPVLLGANGIHLMDSGNWEFEKANYVVPCLGRTLTTITNMRDLPHALALISQDGHNA